jgi:hypothetical protein
MKIDLVIVIEDCFIGDELTYVVVLFNSSHVVLSFPSCSSPFLDYFHLRNFPFLE